MSELIPTLLPAHGGRRTPPWAFTGRGAIIAATILNRPRTVIPTPFSAPFGAPPAHAFPRLRRKDGSERRHTHAILVFDDPVRGPLVRGAGRYRGYGLCGPMCIES